MNHILLDFKRSNAWDAKNNLPLVPQHNNPWLYMAYAIKIIMRNELGRALSNEVGELISQVKRYHRECFVGQQKPMSLVDKELKHPVNRWPGSRGGLTSFDELLGLVSIGHFTAKSLLTYLDAHYGFYNNTGERHWNPFKFFIYRYFWFRPYLLRKSGQHVGYFGQLVWSLLILGPSLVRFTKPKSDFGQYLRAWLMFDTMNTLPICAWFIKKFRIKMLKLNFSPKTCYQNYLTQCSVYEKHAPTYF